MTREELWETVIRTSEEIKKIKQQVAEATDLREKRRLIRKKRELQRLQFWCFDKLKWRQESAG